LPKWERWAIEYKRNTKKELTKHTQLLKAWEKDAKDAKAQNMLLERPTMRCKKTKSVSKVAIWSEKKQYTVIME
jgi:hypothetical protein